MYQGPSSTWQWHSGFPATVFFWEQVPEWENLLPCRCHEGCVMLILQTNFLLFFFFFRTVTLLPCHFDVTRWTCRQLGVRRCALVTKWPTKVQFWFLSRFLIIVIVQVSWFHVVGNCEFLLKKTNKLKHTLVEAINHDWKFHKQHTSLCFSWGKKRNTTNTANKIAIFTSIYFFFHTPNNIEW